jgi:hypothetical protein
MSLPKIAVMPASKMAMCRLTRAFFMLSANKLLYRQNGGIEISKQA